MTEEKEIMPEKFPKKDYIKHQKPKFRRQESWRYKRVTDRWRRPHGIDSKMRKKIKGWPASPTTGYRSPKKSRGLHPSGFLETRVQNIVDLSGIDPDIEIIILGGTGESLIKSMGKTKLKKTEETQEFQS